MPDLLTVFARNMKHHRTSLGLSQEELAHKTDLHRTYIGSVERCERNISLRNLEKIAVALGVEPSKLLAQKKMGN
jgi:transcriptional regulator with XRE-family HTH domain